jgi:hypothetical protein
MAEQRPEPAPVRPPQLGVHPVSKAVDEIVSSIIEEFRAGRQSKEELEAKALFRLLNYCPPLSSNAPLSEKPADLKG